MTPQERYRASGKKKIANDRWRAAHPEECRAQHRRALLKRRAIIDAAKDRPYMDCKKKYPPYVMDFDHVRGKKLFNIGRSAGQNKAAAAIRAEIKKCEVVCSNYHRIRTRASERS